MLVLAVLTVFPFLTFKMDFLILSELISILAKMFWILFVS